MFSTLRRSFIAQAAVILFLGMIVAVTGYYLEKPFIQAGRYSLWQSSHSFLAYLFVSLLFVRMYQRKDYSYPGILSVILGVAALSGMFMRPGSLQGPGLFAHIVISFMLLSSTVLSLYKNLFNKDFK